MIRIVKEFVFVSTDVSQMSFKLKYYKYETIYNMSYEKILLLIFVMF